MLFLDAKCAGRRACSRPGRPRPAAANGRELRGQPPPDTDAPPSRLQTQLDRQRGSASPLLRRGRRGRGDVTAREVQAGDGDGDGTGAGRAAAVVTLVVGVGGEGAEREGESGSLVAKIEFVRCSKT